VTAITIENFTKAMEEAVAERGSGWLYPDQVATNVEDDWHTVSGTCQYQTKDGTPACIIGVALSKIDPDLVPEYDTNKSALAVLRNLGAGEALALAADVAQGMQDSGLRWGVALEEYRRVLSMYDKGGRNV